MFSIIIPVHNSETTIKKCLDSIIAQTFSDFEVLLIENGSIDQSFDKCCEYAETDARFKAFDIGVCNGPSKARNIGLEMATGEFVAFLDSDDYWGDRFLEMLANSFDKDTDVVFFSFNHENKDGTIQDTIIPKIAASTIKEKALELNAQGCFGYTCCKAFRRDVVNGITFNETLNLYEDEIFALDALRNARSVVSVPNTYYYYYYHVLENDGSLMRKIHNDIIEKKELQFRAWSDFLNGEFDEALTDMANDAVKYCRFYAYEHAFNVKDAFIRIKKTTFFQTAMTKPTSLTRRVFSSLFAFWLDWIIWRIKHEYVFLFSRGQQ